MRMKMKVKEGVRAESVCEHAGEDAGGDVHRVEDGEEVAGDAGRDPAEGRVHLDVEVRREERVEQPVKTQMHMHMHMHMHMQMCPFSSLNSRGRRNTEA